MLLKIKVVSFDEELLELFDSERVAFEKKRKETDAAPLGARLQEIEKNGDTPLAAL